MKINVQSQLFCNFVHKCRIFFDSHKERCDLVQINSKCIMFGTYVEIRLNPHLADLCQVFNG